MEQLKQLWAKGERDELPHFPLILLLKETVSWFGSDVSPVKSVLS